jgi:hypothetical protein
MSARSRDNGRPNVYAKRKNEKRRGDDGKQRKSARRKENAKDSVSGRPHNFGRTGVVFSALHRVQAKMTLCATIDAR